MGDRANIYIVDDEDASRGIYYYTHSSGYRWPEKLRQALIAGKSRWGDDQYLARIIASNVFSEIHDGETGGGISTRIGDNEHPIIIADLLKDQVAFAGQGSEKDRDKWSDHQTFAQYVAQDKADYPHGFDEDFE